MRNRRNRSELHVDVIPKMERLKEGIKQFGEQGSKAISKNFKDQFEKSSKPNRGQASVGEMDFGIKGFKEQETAAIKIAKLQQERHQKDLQYKQEINKLTEKINKTELDRVEYQNQANQSRERAFQLEKDIQRLREKEKSTIQEINRLEKDVLGDSEKRLGKLQAQLNAATQTRLNIEKQMASIGTVDTGRLEVLKKETAELEKQKNAISSRISKEMESLKLTPQATAAEKTAKVQELQDRRTQLLTHPRTGKLMTEQEFGTQPRKIVSQSKRNEFQTVSGQIEFLSGEGTGSLQGLQKQLDQLTTSYNRMISEVAASTNKAEQKARLDKEWLSAKNKETDAESQLKQAKEITPGKVEEAKGKLDSARASQSELQNQLKSAEAAYNEEIRKLNESTDAKAKNAEETTRLKQELAAQRDALRSISGEIQGATRAQRTYNREMDAARAQRKDSMSFLQEEIKHYLSWTVAIGSVIKIIRSSYTFISDLDKALTEISITTKMTTEQTWQLAQEYNALGKELSKSTVEIAKSAAIFFRQGKSIAETNAMMRAVIIASSLEGVPMEETASRLTASLNAYKKEATEALSVTSKFAAVGAASASSFGELTYALTKTGAGANMVGFNFDHLLGVLATVIETTREAPENIGKYIATSYSNICRNLGELLGNP